jgi:lipoprotein signal peptidase
VTSLNGTAGRRFLLTAGIVFTVDAATKAWARRLPAEGVQRSGFRLRLQYNAGGAFGWGNHHSALFGLVTVAFVGYCGVVTWRKVRSHTAAGLTPMALMCGGAAGNLLDRLSGGGHGPLSGSVADWLHVTGYPFAFNLADVAIRVGAAGLTISLWRASTTAQRRTRADDEDRDCYDVEPEPFCGSSTSA